MGDTAYLIELEGELNAGLLARVRGLAETLRADALEGVVEIVPAFASVGVIYEPERVPTPRGELPWRVVGDWIERHLAGKGATTKTRKPRTHLVPVCYGGEHGPDLELVAKATKRDVDAVVKLHSGADYQVAALGFSPGFPYLLGLPAALVTPRRSTPRARVAAGSVGIGGRQTGIYPGESPGGWQLIGRTNLSLFEPGAGEPVRMAVGDQVKFKAVKEWPPAVAGGAAKTAKSTGSAGGGAGWIEVVKPGTLTTVQGGGRRGMAQFGIGAGGAMDAWAAMAANIALGNAPEAGLLECTYVGPILRFTKATTVVVLGAEVDGVASGRPLSMAAGQELDLTTLIKGARVYLAVAGGLRVPEVLGSVATAVGGRFGGHEGRALEAGDRLAYGSRAAAGGGEAPAAGNWRVAAPVLPPGRKDAVEVRLVPGPDWERFFPRRRTDAAEVLAAHRFHLSAKSDRMGLRLTGEPLAATATEERWSRAVVPGTVQVPPDGQPIVLMAEGQTIGGYAQLGQVASIDLPRLAQARPGAEIIFRVVDLSEAQSARLRSAAELARLKIGLAMRR